MSYSKIFSITGWSLGLIELTLGRSGRYYGMAWLGAVYVLCSFEKVFIVI